MTRFPVKTAVKASLPSTAAFASVFIAVFIAVRCYSSFLNLGGKIVISFLGLCGRYFLFGSKLAFLSLFFNLYSLRNCIASIRLEKERLSWKTFAQKLTEFIGQL